MKLNTIEDLFVEQLHDLYATEKELTVALPKMAEKVSTADLKKAFNEHIELTQNQLNRLEDIYTKLGLVHGEEKSEAAKGLVKEGEELMKSEGNPFVKDAALIAAAQRIEHYEIAGYGCARTYAHELGYTDIEKMLQDTLDEEGATDKLLTKIAEGGLFSGGGINRDAPLK